MWTIRQDGDKWVLLHNDAELSRHDSKEQAASQLVRAVNLGELQTQEGLLPERWKGTLATSVKTDDGRDFSKTEWSWRDAETARMPLMWQEVNEIGHYNSVLAGYIDTIGMSGSDVEGGGVFFDSDAGRAFRDVLNGAGRWGVSVDPGDVEAEETCLEWDEEWGWCNEYEITFLRYQIIGVTGTPFPAMEGAFIELDAAEQTDEDDESDGDESTGDDTSEDEEQQREAVTASSFPHLLKTPAEWFDHPAELASASEPVPFTLDIDRESPTFGRFYGHLADKTTCHSTLSGPNSCVTVPQDVALSRIHYGVRQTTNGMLATGPMIFGTEHLMDLYAPVQDAIDHYAHTGSAWGDARFGVDEHGVWCAGAIRSIYANDDDVLQVIAASNQSGDWREINNELKLIACLTVNIPAAAPSHRLEALVASGKPHPKAMVQRTRTVDGRVVAAVGWGMVRKPCAECAKRKRQPQQAGQIPAALASLINEMRSTQTEVAKTLAKIERRTRPGYAEAQRQRREAIRQRIDGVRVPSEA